MKNESKREIKMTVFLFLIVILGCFAASYFLGIDIKSKMEHSGIILCAIFIVIGLARFFIKSRSYEN